MQRTAVFALFVAIALGVGTWWAIQRRHQPPPAPSAPWLRLINPADVASIVVTLGPRDAVTLARLDGTDLWLMRRVTESRVMLDGPIRAEQVRGLVRLLHEVDELPSTPNAEAFQGSIRVSVYSDTDHVGEVELGDVALGGKIPIRLHAPAGPRVVLADARLVAVVSAQSLEAWRDPAVLSRLPGEPHRLRLDAEARALSLARAGAGWNILDPVLAPAQLEPCVSLLARLTTLTGRATAIPQADAASLPLRAVFEIETPTQRVHMSDVDTRLLRQTARVHEDPAGRLLAVVRAEWIDGRTTSPAWSDRVVELEARLADLPRAEAGPFLSRLASRLVPADVAGLRLGEPDAATDTWRARYSRTLDGWRRDPEASVITSTESAQITTLLKLLCDTDAATATLDPPADAKPFARLALVVGGHEAESFTLSLGSVPLPSGVTEVLIIRAGNVCRVYHAQPINTLLRWLHAASAPEG
ncbi:MAG: hypothetical protein HBSAPP03_21380 [Phycisphaerae bacterium]|nr:MAG: hypothetical protein HBSAPP03_21380 [Phycisphaerae bacterium]